MADLVAAATDIGASQSTIHPADLIMTIYKVILPPEIVRNTVISPHLYTDHQPHFHLIECTPIIACLDCVDALI